MVSEKNRNTADAILEFLDNTYDSFNESKQLLAIFLDFSKAFDTINHDILMRKLDHMGFRGPIKSWIGSYLRNRKQYVDLGGTSSDTLDVKMGVPQGSTLGPLLFILYINDMKNCIDALNVIHFADDSTMYIKYKGDMSEAVNRDLMSLHNWLTTNKLILNVGKTNYMILNNRKSPTNLALKIGNSDIERTKMHKFLGVHIDERLTFKDHTSKLCSKIASSVGLLRRLHDFVPVCVLRQLHYALVHSKFTYAITTYGSANQNSLQKLVHFVNKSLKIVTNSNRITLDVGKSKKMFDFHLAHKYFSCIKLLQVQKLEMHPYFRDKINSFQVEHNYGTRVQSDDQLSTPSLRFLKCQKSFLYVGIKFWNELPLSVRNSENLKAFKKNLRGLMFS